MVSNRLILRIKNLYLSLFQILLTIKKRGQMKRFIFIMMAVMLFAIQSKAQVVDNEDFTGATMILDSTITQDQKLSIAADRLYAESETGTPYGLVPLLIQQVSKEKAENGKVEKALATQNFVDDVNKAYQKYLLKFLKVDTIYVDKKKVAAQIVKIQNWQTSVLNDAEIKNATSLAVWEQKQKRLQKLLRYQSQLNK